MMRVVQGERRYIPTLDGWRAVAVLLVVGAHAVPLLQNGGYAPALAAFFNHAGYGVDVFFSISGFLITTLLLDEMDRDGGIDFRGFFTRRAFRILPPMLLYLAALIVLSPLLGLGTREVVASLFFYKNYVDGIWYTGHFWSLSIEEQFYLAMPMLIMVLHRRGLLLTCLLVVAACILLRTYELGHQGYSPFRTEVRVDGLMWGSILAQVLRSDRAAEWMRRALNPLTVAFLVTLTIIALTLITDQAVRRTTTASVIPLVLASTVLRPRSFPSQILESRPFRSIGRRSYSLYLWQMLFLVPASRPLGELQAFPLALVLPVVCAFMSYRFVEKPFIKLGHSLVRQPLQAQAARSPQAE